MNLYNEIAKVAYGLYEKSGYVQGREFDHWFEAEKIVMARFAEEEKKKEEKKKTENKTETKTKKTVTKKAVTKKTK